MNRSMFRLSMFLTAIFVACGPADVVTVQLDKYAEARKNQSAGFASPYKEGSRLDALYPDVQGVPADWRQTTIYFEEDFPQLLYQGFCAGCVDEKLCMRYFDAWGRDTASCSARPIRVLKTLVTGLTPDGRYAYLFDTDGDDDVSDEKVHYFEADSTAAAATAVRIDYYVNGTILHDSTYLRPRCKSYGMLLYCDDVSRGRMKVGGTTYDVTVYPDLRYDHCDTSIVFENRDTTINCHLKEYVQLDKEYYLIDSLRRDGRELTLVRDPEALNRPSLQIGFRPYPFEAQTLDGRTVRFPDDYKGHYVLLDFWALGCGPCIHEIRTTYRNLYEPYHAAGFELLAVAADSAEDLNAYLPELQITWPVIADRPDNRLVDLYRIDYFPTLFLLDPEGRIIARGGELRGESLAKMLRTLYPDVPVPETAAVTED